MAEQAALSSLSPEQKQWFRLQMRERGIPVLQIPLEVRSRDDNGLPLSYSQERLWLMEQLGGTASSYHLHQAIRITGRLQTEHLEASLRLLASSHESFRTSFTAKEGKPQQHIAAGSSIPLQRVKVTGASEAERLVLAEQAAQPLLTQPFDLGKAPLLRTGLYELEEDDHILVFVIHHIVADGWSLRLLTSEWMQFYNALCKGQSPIPKQRMYDYADYACWQREWMQADMLAEGLNYWKEQLRGVDPFYTIPSHRPRPRLLTSGGDSCMLRIEAPELEALRALARSAGASLFMTVMAAFNVLLYRYTGRGDVVVGTPTAGRCREETEEMLGCFVNNLVLRTDIREAGSFTEVLQLTTQTVLGALKAQEVPFEHVLDALNPLRDMAYSPLFQLFFIFQQGGMPPDQLDGAVCTPQKWTQPSAKFDMTLEVIEHLDHLDVMLEYNTDLYDKRLAEGLLANYVWMLGHLPAQAHLPLPQLPLISPLEETKLRTAGTGPGAAYPERSTLHSLVERQAAATPPAVAVVCGSRSYTYAELYGAAEKLAAYLQLSGCAGPGHRVGICASPSFELAAGILGILISGSAYVPLDPAFPEQRLQFIAGHAELDCILIDHPAEADRFGEHRCCDISPGSECWQTHGALSDSRLSDQPHQAYMIYTSGSTGQPKGVAVTHRNAVHFLYSMQELLHMTPEDSLLSVTTCSFDIFLLELFLPLFTGASVIFPQEGSSADPGLLMGEIDRYKPTFMQATPVLWRLLLGEGWKGSEYINLLSGGEELKPELAAQLFRRGKTVWNLYGPTETAVWSLAHKLTPDDLQHQVPIGRPIGRTSCLVLDDELALLPMGAEGTLYIGGDGVTDGYHRQPELTAQKFILNPLDQAGGLLFNTGDRVRLQPGGEMVYLGRKDQQLKLRGFRIEPSEIEQQLNLQPGVAASAVVACDDGQGEQLLAAYWVPSPSATNKAAVPDEAEWKQTLRGVLPGYMIPARFIKLAELPLTPNRKVDRKFLAGLPLDKAVLTRSYTAPRSSSEIRLAEVWGEVLNRTSVGIHDHFFDLGGNSLLAVKLLTEIRSRMKVELTLRQLLIASTIANVAAELDAAGVTPLSEEDGNTAKADLPEFKVSPHEAFEAFPLTEVQMAYWSGRGTGSAATHVYQEMEFAGLDIGRFEQCFQVLVKRHPMLRARVLPDGVQQILEEVPPYQIRIVDASGCSEPERVSRLDGIRQLMSHTIHSGSWPMFAIEATRLPEGLTRLHISFDLMIADARSFQIILEELAELYAGAAIWPPLEATFRDYVLSLLSITSADRYRMAQSYWQERIPCLPAGPQLPAAVSQGPKRQEFKRWKAVLPARLWSKLSAAARRRGLTSSALLLTCYAEVLALYAKQPHFLLNLTLFNRLPLHPQMDQLVGDFTTISLLEVDYREPGPFSRRAEQLQERLWTDLDHRLYSGIRVTEQLLANSILSEPVPVVFTSLLDLSGTDGAKDGFDQIFQRRNEPETEARSLSETPQVWLDHQVAERDGELHYNWDAVEGRFPAGVLEEMFSVYGSLLRRLTEEEDTWEQLLPLAGPGAAGFAHRLRLAELDTRHRREPEMQDIALHQGFQRMAHSQPNAPALIAGGNLFSYGELNRKSNAVAHQLVAYSVQPGTLVAVVMDKGWEQVAAVLGIMKAGAAYLPVDASLPAYRISELLELGQVQVALVQSSALPGDFAATGIRSIEVNENTGDEDTPEYGSDVDGTGDQLAYVLFTSGSTGTPKGVMISHQAAVNTLADINRSYRLNPQDVVLGLSSLSFDLSVFDIFGCLAAGGTLVLPDPQRLRDPGHWLELMQKQRVTVWNSVPAFMNMLLLYAASEVRLDSLRLCLLSGDWIPSNLPGAIRRLNPGAEVIALGGATEAAVWSIQFPVHTVDPAWANIPYGLSMSGQRVYVLNARMEECPVAVPGELYIGGVGVAVGYWRDEVRTAEHFVMSPITGERLYRTGDWGRYGADGVIEFLGRDDLQVKISGYRIELSEIESALKTWPGVQEAAVLAEGEEDARRLRAFVILRPDRQPLPDAAALRAHLRSRLPGYMVPYSISLLEEFPLTTNGKIDRKALLATPPETALNAAGPPKSELEEAILSIWRELLNRQIIGRDEHFFDLGGNSLKLVQMQLKLQEMLDREIPIVELFRHTSVAALVEFFGSAPADKDQPGKEQKAAERADRRFQARQTRRR
ncbi:non-ribosomal peptide synthetase [Paenibacillus albidus]|uniref:Phenyloxazoline synthase MbtB n=1 Tax=Paenibacillus albidus TaxID=2041023 RepID=A0A917C2Y1_9BACL|nr:non-ribosomal peptide synthetase [Paenibacillus albidus]GGF69381.1 non-ribosomal peptide synthetase [Paenibacillus albidus]